MPNLEYIQKSKRLKMSPGDLILRIAAGLAVLAFLLEVALPALFANKSIRLATTAQIEPVTELYFVDHVHLPKEMPAGVSTEVSFHIQNNQGKDLIYYPRVTLFEDGAPHRVPQRALPVTSGAGQDVPVFVDPAKPGENLELVIDLPDQGISIHFRSRS
jgi:hypothetical protein